MEHFTMVHAFIFRMYRAIPFLFELKTIYDWTFSHTSLNLFQWIKVEDSIYYFEHSSCNFVLSQVQLILLQH
jgi:hypothetical protein